MDASATVVIFLSYLAAFLATRLALAAWQQQSPGNHWLPWSRPFAIMMLALAQWSLALALELSAQTTESAVVWRMLQMVGVSIMPVAWLLFAAGYSKREHLVSANTRRFLYAISFVTIVLALTNTRHGLLWQSWPELQPGAIGIVGASPGVWSFLQVLYSCLLLVAGVAFFARTTWQAWRAQRRHLILVVAGAVLPITGYVLQVFGYDLAGRASLLPYFLVAGVAALVWTVSRQQLLDLVPIARETVLTNMPDAVLVMNSQDRLVDINPAGERLLGVTAQEVRGQRLVELKPEWRDMWYEGVIKGDWQTETVAQVNGERRHYDVHISPLYTRGKYLTGRLLILRDITAYKQTEHELSARQQLFENLVAVARATSEGTSLQATLQNSLDVTKRLTAAEFASLFLLDSSGRVTHSILARGETAASSQREIVGAVMDKGVAGWVVRHRKPALISDTREDERWVNFDDQPYSARSVLAVSITSGEGVPGVLTLQHSAPGFFDDEDEALLRAASDQMALALQKAQLYEEQIWFAERQQTLFEALKTVGRHLEPGTVTQSATEAITRLTGWSAAAILTPDSQSRMFTLTAGSGLLSEREGDAYPAQSGLYGRAHSHGQTEWRVEPPAGNDGDDPFARLHSAIFVPLNHAQRHLGVLVVGVQDAFALEKEDVQLAESFAEAVALAMANAELFQAVADEHSKLRALIESSRDGIILVGKKGEILFLNHKAIELLGYSRNHSSDRRRLANSEPEDWMYRPLQELLAPVLEEAADLVRPLAEFARSGSKDAQAGKARPAEGDVEINNRSLHWQNLPVQSEQTTVGRLIVLQDVTEERRLQRMRDDLTHTMVHDLRNPLNVISGALDTLERKMAGSTEADVARLIELAQYGTGRILSLVNGILHISKLESGNMPLNRQALDLDELIKDALEAQRPLADKKNISLELINGMANGSLPAADADEELVQRVLQNLVSNAIKFTPPGGVVSVSTECHPGTDMLHVEVHDSGPGVPHSIQGQLFQKFVTGLHEEKGSGLGLAFCKMAVEAHGGRIWLENSPGEGATFTFTLPKA